jgi:hypothetical protein
MTDLRKVVTDHIKDLRKTAIVLAEYPQLKNSSLEVAKAADELEAALAQPEQEPVAWQEMVVANLVRLGVVKHKAKELAYHFYTYDPPPRKEWVGLHLDDMPDEHVVDRSFLNGAVWAEAKLKEKNGG